MKLFLLVISLLSVLGSNIDCQVEKSKKWPSNIEKVNYFTKVPPPSIFKDRVALSKVATGNFQVQWIGYVPAEVQTAVNYAVSIWNQVLTFSTPIIIQVGYTNLFDTETLGGLSLETEPIFYNNKFYMHAAANIISGSDLNWTEAEMFIELNNDLGDIEWYTGIDQNVPANKVDMVTVVLHEIAHGLGWTNSFRVNDQYTLPLGEWGISYNNSIYPNIFDEFVSNNDNQIINTNIFQNGSNELGAQLTGGIYSLMGMNQY